MSPRIHGTGPGAAGVGGGVEGATGVAACCPNIVLADTDAATTALTKSRRRMVVIVLLHVSLEIANGLQTLRADSIANLR